MTLDGRSVICRQRGVETKQTPYEDRTPVPRADMYSFGR